MIAIINTGKKSKDGLTEYVVQINYDYVATFHHSRSNGLSYCLALASAAVASISQVPEDNNTSIDKKFLNRHKQNNRVPKWKSEFDQRNFQKVVPIPTVSKDFSTKINDFVSERNLGTVVGIEIYPALKDLCLKHQKRFRSYQLRHKLLSPKRSDGLNAYLPEDYKEWLRNVGERADGTKIE